jgi:carboxylesterase type B
MGAYHQSEIPLLFGTHGNYRSPSTELQIAVSESMQDAWRAFADNPLEGLVGKDWPQFTPQQEVVRWFGDNGTVAQNRIGSLKGFEDQC